MRIREMKWKDYSLTPNRVHFLREYCRDSDNMSMVTQAAACASPSLAFGGMDREYNRYYV